MRKLLMLVTILLVPALANAWTFAVKVTNTTAGIAAGNKATVTIGTTSTDVTANLKYFVPPGPVTVAVTNAPSATVSLVGGALPAGTLAGTTRTYVIPANATKTLQTLNVVYATAATAVKANLSVVQTPGGMTQLVVGSSSTVKGFTGVPVGTSVTVKPNASTGYSLTSVDLNGAPLAAPYTFTVADATADVVTAFYTKDAVVTATLALAQSGPVGTDVTATVTATGATGYAWTVNGIAQTSTTNTMTFSPVAGANMVQVTIAGATVPVVKSASLMGYNATEVNNFTCTSCHSGSTPAILTAYNSSSHATSCQDCHTSAAHTAKTTASMCGTCHTAAATASKHTLEIAGFDCGTCHSGTASYGYNATPTVSGASMSFARTSSASLDHRPELYKYATSDVCASCHSQLRTEFRSSIHWNNHLEYDSVAGVNGATETNTFLYGAVTGQLNANEGWTTTENGKLVTCALNCHFKPNLGPDPRAKNARATLSPGKDECLACHDPHKLTATYLTCHDCHRQTSATRAANTGHGLIPAEFYGSKHWQNNVEYDDATMRNQLNTSYAPQHNVANARVISHGTYSSGRLNANDSYYTEEKNSAGVWGVVTCAYRCHFRPGMGPEKNVGTVLANGKSTGYITYTDTTGKYGTAGTVYSRPGGDSCMACHDSHSLEEVTAQSTCYTCHAGGNHGWSVAAFEKSTHFTGTYAKADGMNKESCLACHDAHSTEATFATMSSTTVLDSTGSATGCQKCHTPGATYSIFNADLTGKEPHFQTALPGADGYYPTGSYDGGGSTCLDCHYHNNTINAGWAKGGHASTTSIPLVTSAADNWNRGTKRGANISTDPVTQYNGDYSQQASVSDCQRCHTAPGFKLFYDSGFKNVSTVREGIKTSAPISCDACHVPKTAGTKLYNGAVRPLAAGVKNVKTYVGNAKHLPIGTPEQTSFMTFSSAGVSSYKNSNVCIPCHAGRGTGALIKKTFAAGSESTTLARDIMRIGTDIYAHFASAAGVVNGSSAYEYSTPALANTHMKIGTGTAFGTGNATMGPCVGCHMTSTEGHSLESVKLAADGTINGFATPVCTNCHGVSAPALTPADVQTAKQNFEAALNMLRNLLLERGFDGIQAEIDARPGERVTMDMSFGYDDYVTAGGTLSKKDFAERNTGAAFNWWQFGKSFKDTNGDTIKETIILGDPAAYVHNPTYAKEVILESMDWLDDFQMNNSITAAQIDALAGHPVKTYSGVADGVAADPVKAKAYFGL